jgi:uncharacterized membrane protein YfcA
MRGAGLLLAAIIGASAFGGLFFTLATVVYLYAVGIFRVVTVGDQAFKLVVAVVTTIGVILGAWVGALVFRWLSAPQESEVPTRDIRL